MPSKLPSIGKAVSLVSLSSRPFVCPSCRYKQARALSSGPARSKPKGNRKARGTPLQIRSASTTAAVTAVNVRRDVPPRFKDLHESVKALETEAAVYVNISQLHLALRGLESENAVTRIAVLGLNGHSGPRRLARALLADPLAPEQRWENQLTADDTDERALLLRYGEQANVDDRHPLVKTLSIPSATLHNHKLEILVQASSAADPFYGELGAANLLVPGLETQSSTSGRLSTVTYPVHKTIIYQEGLQDLKSIPKVRMHEGRIFKVIIDWSWSTLQRQSQNGQSISPINLALGEAAIDIFRQSLQRSVEYEHMWFDAGMPGITAWISDGTEAQNGDIKPAIRGLLQTICNNTKKMIAQGDESSIQRQKASTISVPTKDIIEQGISIWAENAHTELRDRLNSAFHSRSWRRIKWWKLFWRVDDVGYVASDILQKAWLVEAEKEMIWISGRIHQSGLLGPPKLRPPAVLDPDDEQTLGGHPPAPSVSDLVEKVSNYEVVEDQVFQHPWLQTISRARSTLSRFTVPPLQSLSQSLLLQTLSTNALTSSLSALLYVSVSTTSPYEAGAIAAVGLVWSLRRLQTKWENARSTWEAQIREDGRRVLRNVEEVARKDVREGGMGEVDEFGREERRKAREAVARAERALEETSP
ncbi:MAG: hypothetical protein ALECFALPRED_009680 [Alectoria fallacina]|uniref:Mmc1 C-terminal domain-containing protein n=1 Tax=Alectoria fallacina TaxID=1903189 RepID=A0A8H3EY86_9LECA|nr:MAG: hypothetical protein ALECFALPRED_009680 [Alectoria fallacina]